MAAAKTGDLTWDKVNLAPVVLIKSKEEALADRAWDRLLGQARQQDPDIEVVKIDAGAYEPGQLGVLASPSLFGGAKIALAYGMENMTDDFQADAIELIKNPSPDLYLIAVREGGNKGVKLFTAANTAGAPVVTINEVKWDSDKLALLKADARRVKRTVTEDGFQALVDGLGSNVREMLSALQQLFSDVEGTIDETHVKKYFGGRVEANGFEIADALVMGNLARALQLLRHALATGAEPVPLVAALAWKFRQLAHVSASMGRNGRNITPPGSPNQIRVARNQLRSWSDAGLGGAITAIAQADSDVKGFHGEAKDPTYALEKCVREIVRARKL